MTSASSLVERRRIDAAERGFRFGKRGQRHRRENFVAELGDLFAEQIASCEMIERFGDGDQSRDAEMRRHVLLAQGEAPSLRIEFARLGVAFFERLGEFGLAVALSARFA